MPACLSVGLLVADHLCAPIPRLPKSGELVLTDHLLLNIGGCASNAAMDLARLGVDVGVVGCVGQDAFGRFVIETLAARGIDTSTIRQLPDVGTSGTLIINVSGEDRRLFTPSAPMLASRRPIFRSKKYGRPRCSTSAATS